MFAQISWHFTQNILESQELNLLCQSAFPFQKFNNTFYNWFLTGINKFIALTHSKQHPAIEFCWVD